MFDTCFLPRLVSLMLLSFVVFHIFLSVVCSVGTLKAVDALLVRRLFYLDEGERTRDRSDLYTPGIASAGMDGSRHRFIYRDRWLIGPSHLTLDQPNQRIYFTDSYLSAIFAIGYDGEDRLACPRKCFHSKFIFFVFYNSMFTSFYAVSDN